MTRHIVIPYKPRAVFLPFHNRSQRYAAIVAHRRCGKTVACINDKVRRAVMSDRPFYRAAYVAPFLRQAKDVAWDYLKRYTAPIQARPPNESELWVEVVSAAGTPSRVRIYGADNAEALRGGYLDDATLDEYADMHPGVWGVVIRPMLADRQGSATFIGTPKGRNSFWEIVRRARLDPERWFTATLRASETGILPPAELLDARRDMTPEMYEQEFECSFEAAILGAYYGREMAEAEREHRITDAVEPEPGIPVHTAWDLGMGDSTAIIFFQGTAGQVRIIDAYENHGQPLSHYAGVVFSKGFHRKGARDYVPHDARVRELGTGRTRVEILKELGLTPELVPDHKIMDGINGARMTLPHCWFHPRTGDLQEALRQYRTEYDEKTRAFKNTPRHDWTSHYADAFRYLAMVWREQVAKVEAPPKPLVKSIGDWTIEEAWTLNEQIRGGSRRV